MSRRREAADLARALLLSTQEASTVAHLSPHTLSSSKSGTQDSKEMELHALLQPPPSAPSASIPPSIPSSANWGYPPVVRTFAQDGTEGVMPMALPAPSEPSDPIMSALTPSFGGPSAIASFTPTKTNSTPPSIPPQVAATNSSSPRLVTAPRLTPTTSSTGTGSGSSGKVVHSSPNMPIPSSRLSVSDKTHVSSSGSSHRPLFSPPQTSSRPIMPIPPALAEEAPRPRHVTTYGRSQTHNPTTTVLTPAPDRIRSTSPLKASGPPLLPMSTPPYEEPEPVEIRNPPRSSTKSTVEVIVPSRSAGKSRPVSPLEQRVERHHSPDPLDTNLRRQSTSSVRAVTPAASTSKLSLISVPPKSPLMSMAKSRAGSHSTDTQQSDSSSKSMAPARMSKRQQAQKEKEEAETAARREARRVRKEKERMEKERAGEEARRPKDKGAKRRYEEEDESIVALDGPVRRTSISSRGRSTVTPSEVIVFDDKTQAVVAAEDTPAERPSVQVSDEVPTSVRKMAVKDKKRRRVITDEDDEDEEREGIEQQNDTTKQPARDINVVVAAEQLSNPVSQAVEAPTEIADMDDSIVPLPTESALFAVPASNPTSKPSKKTAKALTKPKKSKVSAKAQALADSIAAEKEKEAEVEREVEREIEDAAEAAEEVEGTKEVEEVVQLDGHNERATSSLSSAKSASPPVIETPRPPLRPTLSSVNSASPGPSHRASPGPSNLPGGIKWKTSRSDLSSVLSKFGGARQSGMSRRSKIVSLHSKIGPPVKALPPPPPKPTKKKKGDSDDEEDSDEAEMESDGEGGIRKKKKVKGMEWYMMED